MKRIGLLLALLIAALTLSCAVFAEEASARKIIIDTDTAADDAAALILAAISPEVEIMGVTVQAGNVSLEQGTMNALAALELADLSVPVYEGSDTRYDGRSITPFSVFGKDGMGDKDLIHPKGKAEDEDAIDFILDTVRSNPGEIEIVILGPATNIAKAIDKDPETMRQVKRFWSMGTTGIYGPGNASPVAEFNVYLDAQAYSTLLDFGVPVTVVGLDVCDGTSRWIDRQFDKLASSGRIGRFVTDSFSGIRKRYAETGSKGSVMNCDAMAMMCVVCSDFVTDTKLCHGFCVTDSDAAYGQVIFYLKDHTYDLTANEDFNYNVTLICDVRRTKYFTEYLSRILGMV